MKNIFINTIRFLVNSNIWIALATVCFYELSLLQIGLNVKLNSTAFFLFFSTLFVYNLFRILGTDSNHKHWYIKNHQYTKIFIFLSLIASLISFYFIDKSFLSIILLAGVLTILYVGPFAINTKSSFNLRKFWLFKSITVAVVWVLLTTILPLLENNVTLIDLFYLSIEKFFFILGITIPYDIKDMVADKSDGLKTLVMKFGINKTKLISNGFLFVGLSAAILINGKFLIPAILVYFTAMYLNLKLDERKDELWYTFLVDGTIILYFLAIYFVICLNQLKRFYFSSF